MFLVLIAFLIKDLPVCMNGDSPIKLSGNEELKLSFKVYNPTEYLKVECLDKSLDAFNNCSRYNLFVERGSFYVRYGTIHFLVSGHTINMTISGKDLHTSFVLELLVINIYGEVNCTFNFHTDEMFGTTSSNNLTGWTERISSTSWAGKIPSTSSMSIITTYAIVCGFSALVFCVSGCIFKRVRKRTIIL